MTGEKTTIRITDNNLEVFKIDLSLEVLGNLEICMITETAGNSLLKKAKIHIQTLILSRESEFYEWLIYYTSEMTAKVKEIASKRDRCIIKKDLNNLYMKGIPNIFNII